jgi:hypothetical protein
LRGIFQIQPAQIAIEFFTQSRFSDGIPLFDEAKKMGRIIFDIKNMEVNKLYKYDKMKDGIFKVKVLLP